MHVRGPQYLERTHFVSPLIASEIRQLALSTRRGTFGPRDTGTIGWKMQRRRSAENLPRLSIIAILSTFPRRGNPGWECIPANGSAAHTLVCPRFYAHRHHAVKEN